MIGWIEALHGKFCDTCNRIRLTSIGGIKPCLYYEEAGNLRDLLRKAETSDEEKRDTDFWNHCRTSDHNPVVPVLFCNDVLLWG